MAGRKDDLVLLGGLIVALVVIVSPALGELLAIVQEVERGQGRRLLQALLILATVLVFQQSRKRHEARGQAFAASAIAKQATERAAEMERLVAFGQALGRSLDMDSIKQAAAAHIPLLAPGRTIWAMMRLGTGWKLLATVGDSTPAECERAARRAVGELEGASGEETRDTCFPMIIAGLPIGVLGVASDPPLTDQHHRVVAAAAALLGVSLKNAELFRVVRENSVRDPLTGCFNRRYAIESIDTELRRSRRSQLPLSIVMFDIDHFKRTNDRFGHMAGDAVLATVGARMKVVLRGSDLKCRMGGEEFLILLPDTALNGARHVAESLRREFAEKPVQWNDMTIPVTASFGVTVVTPGERDALSVIERADAALYRAKEEGRNCVRSAEAAAAIA